jgi:hypothetical protein
MKLILMSLAMLLSSAAFANCDISEEEGTEKKYAYLLKADEKGANAKQLTRAQVEDLPEETKECMGQVDLGYELGDGYYDLKFSHTYVIYFPNSTRIAGFVEVAGLTYTEADDPNERLIVRVRYNSRGQRVSPIGSY